ncbi:polysaccharide deacetylase family protein [Clostridium sp. SM-530-WT-3G]|uniref:polysaccharide deacetylase family protein n=1 Tax=Clostridium sp. SM-530-WT-3G TaxID=2725303 RepID=UPI00145F00B0|nr:polysaccharide deacetylase family protein [Clostridium sp. SM-530-WT-3G]
MNWKIKRIGIDIVIIIIISLVSMGLTKPSQVNAGNIEEEIPIYCVDTECKDICLTFDVNWAEKDYLESILNILDKYNAKGTFFVMGGLVNYSEDNVNKLKAIDEKGHEIGNHSYMHPNFTKITQDKMREEVKKTDDVIEKYIGKKSKVFRFPSGDYNKSSFMTVRGMGYSIIQWSSDSVDWKELGAKTEYDRIMKGIKPGAILLFHNNAKYTPGNLEKIIPELQSQGYTFKTVSEVIYFDRYKVDKDGIQHKNN